jgi:small-conductance mechanosensitive channel
VRPGDRFDLLVRRLGIVEGVAHPSCDQVVGAEDAFRIGEYISIGQTRGTVEGIAIRSLKMRHHRGPIHTVPFGEIKQLTNYSRDGSS